MVILVLSQTAYAWDIYNDTGYDSDNLDLMVQSQPVSGRVLASGTNEALIGVTIFEMGTTNGAVTNENGEFAIVVSGPASQLRISYVGYQTEFITVGEQRSINVLLNPDVQAMDEVVVVGYGVQRKSDLTGSVESIKTEDMQRLAVPSVAEALQGRASGVFATRTSGAPGADASIYIRGPGSVNNTAPLWIIDGLPSSAGNHLDISDIESIEILKDASAAAIYGARAANGVILVTTKRGKKGKPKINFSSSYGIAQPLNLPDLVDSKSFSTLRHESYRNGNFQAGLDQVYTRIVNNPDTILPINTDWMDVLYKNGATQNYNLDFSGGNEFSNFFISFGYFAEEGTYINTYFERFTATLNSDHNIANWITVGQSLNLAQTKGSGRHMSYSAGLRVNPFMEVLMDSADHPYTPYGVLPQEYGFVGPNPFGVEDINDQVGTNYSVRGNVYFDIKPIKGLSWRTTLGGSMGLGNNRHYTERYDLGYTLSREFDRLAVSQGLGFGFTGNSILNYQFSVSKHDIEIMAGAEIQDSKGDNYNMIGEDFRDGLIIFNQSDPLTRSLTGNKSTPTRWSSQFGRVNYSFDGKYLFTFNVRRDGSSIFSPGNRIGIFPSFSAGWKVTEESFMESLASVMDLKLRFGYGGVGNPSVAPFAYFSQYTGNQIYYVFGGNLMTGVIPSVFGVGDLRWETIYTTNFGIDLYLLDYRLSITNDFYIKDTRDMLIYIDLPINAGMGTGGSTAINAGNIRNIGNDLNVQYRDQAGQLKYNIGGNFSFNRHKVQDLVDQEINMGELSQFKTIAGEPMSFYEGYQVEGIWGEDEIDQIIEFLIRNNKLSNPDNYSRHNHTAPGDLKFKDINGDGLIDDDDRVNIGNPWPKVCLRLQSWRRVQRI
jgi:TonB-dependent starch-binding outer membrane protein SusC